VGHKDPKTTRIYQGKVKVDRAMGLLDTYLNDELPGA
jgi:hypothetical protein